MSARTGLFTVLAIIAIAAALRISALDSRGVGHLEMYAPNIQLPADLAIPPPRLTLIKTLTGSLWEVHPPAWYLLNYPWTKIAGTTPVALRLPSALCGVLSIWLVWVLARRERSTMAAALATALVAFNGAHVMWSEIARPVMLASLLALASSVVLFRLARTESGRGDLLLYLVFSLVGLGTEYYYWILFGGQMVWVLLEELRERRAAVGLLRWQFLVLILASPLVTLAVSQSRESYLGSALMGTIAAYVGFGFPAGPSEGTPALAGWLPVSAAVAGALLFVVSVFKGTPASSRNGGTKQPRLPAAALWLATLVATVVALGAAVVLSGNGMGSRPKLLVTALAPTLIALVFFILVSLLARWTWRLNRAFHLSTVLAVVPPAVVIGLSLFIPFVDPKYFLLFTPFLAIVLADGIVLAIQSMSRGFRPVAIAVLAAWLVWLHVVSLRYYGGLDATPIGHGSLVAQLKPVLQDDDRIMVFRHYAMTPIFYYLPATPGRYVGENYADVVRESPRTRFWVVSLRDSQIDDPPPIGAAVAGCTLTQTLTALRIRAELYERCAAPPSGGSGY